MEKEIFEKTQADFKALEEYGFTVTNGIYTCKRFFMDGDFYAVITVDGAGGVTGKVCDCMTGEEYLPLRAENRNGAFVSCVRDGYKKILNDIAANCFKKLLFRSEQANRITELIYLQRGIRPDLPWTENRKPDDSGVFRHADTRKWFALIMNIKYSSLDKSGGRSGFTDVINLKNDSLSASAAPYLAGIYPAFHMNHKSWITVLLDNTLPDTAVLPLIDESYILTDRNPSGT